MNAFALLQLCFDWGWFSERLRFGGVPDLDLLFLKVIKDDEFLALEILTLNYFKEKKKLIIRFRFTRRGTLIFIEYFTLDYYAQLCTH